MTTLIIVKQFAGINCQQPELRCCKDYSNNRHLHPNKTKEGVADYTSMITCLYFATVSYIDLYVYINSFF